MRQRYETIERCIARCRETAARDAADYPSAHDRVDILSVNLIRLAEALIDLARHMTKSEQLGTVKDARSAFRYALPELGFTLESAETLSDMVGSRNLAVHNYAVVEEAIIELIVREQSSLPLAVAEAIARRAGV